MAQLKAKFNQLYKETGKKRRMIRVSLHDRIGGTPSIVGVVDKFIHYAKQRSGVVFMRKDNIAKTIKNDPDTPIDNAEITYNK